MEHGRRTGWTGRPRPQHVSAQGSSRTWQVTGLSVLPASHVHTGPKISASGPIETAESNRQTRVFRNAVTHTKQRTAIFSNRQNIRFWKTDNLRATSLSVSALSDDFLAFLTGSRSQTEFDVTHSKHSTWTFLTGSRIAYLRPGHFSGIASLAQTNSSNIGRKLSEESAWLRL